MSKTKMAPIPALQCIEKVHNWISLSCSRLSQVRFN